VTKEKRISIRFNKKELLLLENCKKTMGISDEYGADSRAIKRALTFFLDSWRRPIKDFQVRYGKAEQNIIKEALTGGVI